MLRLLAVAVALLLAPATAQAALTITHVTAPATPLVPNVDQATLEVAADVDCTDAFPNTGVVTFQFMAMPGVVITGPMSADFSCQAPTGRTTVVGQFAVSVSREAPGLQPLEVQVRAETGYAPFSQVNGGPGSDESGFVVVAAPYLLTQVQVLEKIVSCACDQVSIPIHVENLGNVRSVHAFSLVQASDPDARILLPEDLVLGSAYAGEGNNGTAVVQVEVPASGEAAFQLQVDTRAALDPSAQGAPAVINFLVRRSGDDTAALAAEADGGVADIPGPGPLLALGTIAAALLAARRRA